MKIYIIVLNYKTWKDTLECLESLLKLEYDNFQIVVVDNNSPNTSMLSMLDWANGNIPVEIEYNNPLRYLSYPNFPKPITYTLYQKKDIDEKDIIKNDDNKIIFIQSNENRGYAAGNNIGMKYALLRDDFDYVLILNNDTVVESNAICKMLEINKSQSYNMVGGLMYSYQEPNILLCKGGFSYNKWTGKVKHVTNGNNLTYLSGAFMLVTREFINSVGFLNEEYFLYSEEYDWTIRGIQSYGSYNKLYTVSSGIFYHKEGSSITKDKKDNSFSNFYYYRSTLLLSKRFFPFPVIFSIYIIFFLKFIYYIISIRFKNSYIILIAIKSVIHNYSVVKTLQYFKQ